ncbi:MAG: TonB-dependent receptor [Cellvibrionales bacterium]|nr:TonB-dependent receptor [Cellvibrionales bacterium]
MKHRLHAFCCGLFVVLPLFGFSAHAADELLVYVFAQDGPVAGVEVTLDQEVVGVTEADGSLMADVIGDGGHVLSVAYDGRSTTTRFSAGGGQLVDAVARLDLEDEAISVDVYSQTESVADREQAAEGTLFIKVLREGEPLADEFIYIAGSSSLQSDDSGESSVVLPRGRYRVQVAEQTAYLRVVGGVTRAVTVSVNAEEDTIEVAAPALEEVTVIAKFDPSGLELSERDTTNIVDTIGVELLSRFADSDVAASVVRVPGISVQDDKYVFIRGLGGRYISSTLNNATMPSTNPSKRTVPLDLFPSNFVNQLDIKKTFLPYMPGESTGGNLVINTKTFPDERSGRVSFNLGYVTDITGKDVFVDPIDGDFDDLGWDDGSRAEDGAVEAISQILSLGRVTDTNSGVSYELDDQTRGELQRLGGILIKDGYDLDFETATPDAGLQLDYGDLFYFRDSEIGFYAAANYKNEWNQRDQGVRNSYTPTGDLLDNFIYRQYSQEPGVVLRRYDDLIDNNFDVSADLSWDIFDSGASFAKLRVGGQAIYRERDSDTSVYGYNINQARDELLDSDNLLASDVIYVCGDGPGTVVCPANPDLPGAPPEGGISNSPNTGLVFDDKTLASDSYEADLKYNSVYAMYDHTFASSWQVVFGARYEMYEQTTDTFSLAGEQLAVQSVIDEDSVLPSLGVNWFYSETQQLRFAVSQTVARPDFKEAANATFYDNEFNFRVRGNPFLDISDIINADLRWEWFPNETDSYSVAVFYKDMTDPIERVVQPASGTAGNSRTFQNSDEAELYGAEIEGSTEFVLTDDYNQTVFVSFNAAYIESEVTAGNQDNRPLQGQPEYTANLVLGYDNLSAGHQLTLLFNYNGESIADVGVSGAPDVYLEPRGELNFVYRYDISDSATVRARIENILNAEVEYTQGGLVFQSYEKGTTFQLGVDWTF